MNGKSPVERYMPRKPVSVPAGAAVPAEGGFEARPEASVLMLDLVMANGDRFGMPYTYLSSVKLEGNEKLKLTYTEQIVTVEGRNLFALYNHVLAHTARRVEMSTGSFDDGSQASWVKRITVADRQAP